MSSYGFRLVALRLTGKDVEDAEVRFEKGLNVICGPSDTGKTFILQCINFVLGAKDKPKDIASAYDTIFLEINVNANAQSLTLKRSLRGGAIDVIPEGEKAIKLKAKHDKDKQDNLSYYLLKLSGLADRWLKKNKAGVTQSLSFRNLVHLCLITEESIIKEHSPVLTGQVTNKTAELSLFRLLLSGVDDSSIVSKEDPKISRARVESKNELLQDLIENAAEELKELNVEGCSEELQKQLENLEQTYNSTSEALNIVQESMSEMEEKRTQGWTELRQIESRLSVLCELIIRFSVLEKQYNSDLRRLEAIAETGGRLMEMNLDRCAVCGSLSDYHEVEYQDALVNPDVVATSCAAESIKLRTCLSDLKTTQKDVSAELTEKRAHKKSLEVKLEAVNGEIRSNLKPKMKRILSDFREAQQKRESVKRALGLIHRINEYENLTEEIVKKDSAKEQSSNYSALPAKKIDEFCVEVERRLKAWNFPNVDHVTFSEVDTDIVISGRQRASHGKGVRAMMHAAFSLALLRYGIEKNMPYPNFLIIDSPLVVYREPDFGEQDMALDVKNAFYRDIASSFSDAQVIILENEDPASELISSEFVSIIKFTGSDVGRRGFLPVVDK